MHFLTALLVNENYFAGYPKSGTTWLTRLTAISIIAAIEKQSFNVVKAKFVKNAESKKASFLRKETIEQWRKDLSK